MARTPTTKSKSTGRVKATTVTRTGASKLQSASQGRRAPVKTAASSPAASKDDLRARVEKLERANATLRTKNKDLRLAHVAAAEQVEALTLKLESLERRAERQARQETSKTAGMPKPRPATSAARRGRSGPPGQAGDLSPDSHAAEVDELTEA